MNNEETELSFMLQSVESKRKELVLKTYMPQYVGYTMKLNKLLHAIIVAGPG